MRPPAKVQAEKQATHQEERTGLRANGHQELAVHILCQNYGTYSDKSIPALPVSRDSLIECGRERMLSIHTGVHHELQFDGRFFTRRKVVEPTTALGGQHPSTSSTTGLGRGQVPGRPCS